MGVRKNARFLSAIEREDFVKACVLMKADIVNPAALPQNRYSKWDEYVAVHFMIQNAFAPGAAAVNFGHGGSGAFSFLSWHRWFLYEFEKQLQSYVAGVMLPYWDWTDPATIAVDTFLGPDGTTNGEVRSGYFARFAPGTPGNVTPAPTWWPAGLTGWLLPDAFPAVWRGALRRSFRSLAQLPTTNDLRETLQKGDYPAFQDALESGAGLSSFQQMHNGMHGWIGGHMGNPTASPFDPLFYLHHCNIDRLWAMWQADGHADVYPSTGGALHHHRNDLMFPWTGGAAGYGVNAGVGTGAQNIPLPDVAAVGPKRNVDTLDHRAMGYTYDTIAVIGIGLDRTGSMSGITPDPMTTGAPDVTKWEAARRGVSMFLQDCETAQNSGLNYVAAGVRTFRRLLANDFVSALPAPGFGVVRTGGVVSRAAFDSASAAMTTGGSTPLADALLDVQHSVVEAAFGGAPADEIRYLAMFTDGRRTSGSPFSAIPTGSLTRTGVFAMGFGTGAEVDYATLQTLVDKGRPLSVLDATGSPTPMQQVFHGESAGTIDKFYSNALARAIGFSAVLDPVVELFAGEFTHLSFHATSADDAFLVTAQGMDFQDEHWTFALHAPDGSVLHADAGHAHAAHAGCHSCRRAHVTVSRSHGRFTLILQRDNADDACWVGEWVLMAAYRARRSAGMHMPTPGELLLPVAANVVRGPRYARLLQRPEQRTARRNVRHVPHHDVDDASVSTNRSDRTACDLVVNVYVRSTLSLELVPSAATFRIGEDLGISVMHRALDGAVVQLRGLGRAVAPGVDLAAALARVAPKGARQEAGRGDGKRPFDPALALAALERRNPKLANVRDEALRVVSHDGGPLHVHLKGNEVPGAVHVALQVEGEYLHRASRPVSHGGGHHGGDDLPTAASRQRFSRLLTTMMVVESAGRRPR